MRKLKKLVLDAIAESGITEDEESLSTTFEEKVNPLTLLVIFIVCVNIDFTLKVILIHCFCLVTDQFKFQI